MRVSVSSGDSFCSYLGCPSGRAATASPGTPAFTSLLSRVALATARAMRDLEVCETFGPPVPISARRDVVPRSSLLSLEPLSCLFC